MSLQQKKPPESIGAPEASPTAVGLPDREVIHGYFDLIPSGLIHGSCSAAGSAASDGLIPSGLIHWNCPSADDSTMLLEVAHAGRAPASVIALSRPA